MKDKQKYLKIRFDGYSTDTGDFFQAPPTGTFVSGYYPKLYKAYLIVKKPTNTQEGREGR